MGNLETLAWGRASWVNLGPNAGHVARGLMFSVSCALPHKGTLSVHLDFSFVLCIYFYYFLFVDELMWKFKELLVFF